MAKGIGGEGMFAGNTVFGRQGGFLLGIQVSAAAPPSQHLA